MPPTEAVRTSPSGSESLSSTERMVVRPGRTPTASGLVSGGRLGLVRSGRMLMVLLSADSWSWSSDWFLGGMTSSQLLTSCMFWFTSHTLPGIHIVQDHQVPVHPEHIRRRRTRLRHIHRLVIGIIRAVPDILVRPRPRRMHTPAQLHRSRRHTLPAKRHRLRRRTIQRLLQQRLRRRHRHRIRRRTRTAATSHPAPPPTPAHARPAGTTSPGPHPAPPAQSPTTASCRSPAPFNPSHVLDLDIRHRTLGIHRRHRHLPRLRIRTVNPVISTHRRHRPRRTLPAPARNSPHQNRSPSTATTPTPSPCAASVTAMTCDPKLTSADPGNFLSPPNRICAADT